MRFLGKRRFVALSVACAITVVSVAPGVYAAYADTASPSAVLTSTGPGPFCVGDSATLTWTPAADVSALRGYEVEHYTTYHFPTSVKSVVEVGTTTVPVTLRFGFNSFLIRSISSTGVNSTPFASASAFGAQPPQPMTWDSTGNNAVGDASATVSFIWKGPITRFTYGGAAPTVRLTASPGGDSVDIPVDSTSQYTVTAEFTGLTNGVGYTFSAVTFNHCGASAPQVSSVFTTGVAPEWTRNTPPLTASRGQYVYKFAAVGEPAPTFTLLDAPDWLAISAKGLLSGRAPEGTHSFSYSVSAANGVGIEHVVATDLKLGPFTVEVRSP